jgi:Cu/Ag efflux protein CusF
MRTTFNQLLASFLIACATGALAQASTPADSIPMTAGEVRKVDFETKKITLRHEEIKNLGMPQMTMVFRVSDPALLERVKPATRCGSPPKGERCIHPDEHRGSPVAGPTGSIGVAR